jgi:hypothetical protein
MDGLASFHASKMSSGARAECRRPLIRDDGGEGQAGVGRGAPVLPAIRRYRARYGTRKAASGLQL